MYIVLGKEKIKQLGDKYISLELDTFKMNNNLETAYCILDASSIPLSELTEITVWQQNHTKLLENYRQQNWSFCEQMIEHCMTKWGGAVNSFYTELYARIQRHKQEKLPKNWTGVLKK